MMQHDENCGSSPLIDQHQEAKEMLDAVQQLKNENRELQELVIALQNIIHTLHTDILDIPKENKRR